MITVRATMDQRIKLLNRLKMQLSGYVYTGHKLSLIHISEPTRPY